MSPAPFFVTDRVTPISRGEAIDLEVSYLDAAGAPMNTDTLPSVEIIGSAANNAANPGTIILPLTNVGVQQVKDGLGNLVTGRYHFNFLVPTSGFTGVWRDRWVANIGATIIDKTFTFAVISGGSTSVVVEPPAEQLGEQPQLSFNPDEIHNLNILLAALKSTLKNDGVVEQIDPITQVVTLVPCPVFTDTDLIRFLRISLSEFNARPHFSNVTFADPNVVILWQHILVEGANIMALAAQWLVERGREFSVVDNGITFQPPSISEALNTQYSVKLASFNEKLDMIKLNFKPAPLGLGTLRVTAISPQLLRLRHLRERQII